MDKAARKALTAAIGERLALARKGMGWTQRRLAEEAGVDLATLRNIEQGRNEMGVTVAVRLSEALGVSLDALAGRGRA